MNTEDSYHVAKDGQTLGPYSAETIQTSLKDGTLSLDDHLLDPSTNEWVPLSSAGFETEVQLPPPPSPASSPTPVPDRTAPPTPSEPPPGVYTEYSEVPRFQRAGFVNGLTGVAFASWILGSEISSLFVFVAFVLLVAAIICFFKAPVYSKKKLPNGTLKTLNWNYKLAPVVLLAILMALFAWAIVGAILEPTPTGGTQTTAELVSDPTKKAENEELPANAEIIIGKLPISFDPDKTYVLKGLFLIQNLDRLWLTDLTPEILANMFPKGKDPTGLMFSTAMSSYISQGLYQVGQQQVILIPKNPKIFEGINLPARKTLMTAVGKFLKYHTFETTNGASARAPVFEVESLELWSGEKIDLR